jgi:hypothetical protein
MNTRTTHKVITTQTKGTTPTIHNGLGNVPTDDPLRGTEFNGDNLLTWNTNITQLLGSKGLLGYIDGTITKPEQSPPDKPAPDSTPIYSSNPSFNKWNYCDHLA